MIKQIEIKDIPGRACHFNNAVTRDVLDFHNSDYDAVEVDCGKYKNVNSACSAYRKAIKTANVNVIAFVRGDRLFLVRGDKA